MMKAWRVHAFGANGNPADSIAHMTLDDVPVPSPKDGQILIKVEIAAVNPIDWKLLSGGMQGICPVSFPFTPGFDVAGTVAKLGPGVSGFEVGDKVAVDLGLMESSAPNASFGPAGAFAQFAVAPATLVCKTGGLGAAATAGLPLAGLTAWQALFTGQARSLAGEPLGRVAAGHKVLVLGGAAATGCLALQLAKDAGASVATTASGNKMPDGSTKIDFVKSMGADVVVDYKAADWSDTLAGQQYDLIFDCVGDAADAAKASKVLKKGGEFISIANFSLPASDERVKFKNFLLKSCAEDLSQLIAKVAAGKLVVPVDSVAKFGEAKEVLTKSMAWSSAGKLLIQVE